jgi:predicted RNA binding protein YcfA (HicA-like mRNA interferase family)
VKRSELERHLRKHGCEVIRDQGKHTFFQNASNGRKAAVPRHEEINTLTAWEICKDLGVPKPPGR